MTLENKLSAREIILSMEDMSARPEYYSGRGATISDLDSRKLGRIYQFVKKEHGEDAGQNFVQMVANIPVLSATDFLLTFYRLDSNNWKYDQKLLGNEEGIDLGSDYGDGKRESIVYATIVSVLGGSGEIDQTSTIRGEFLRNHGIKEKESSPYFIH